MNNLVIHQWRKKPKKGFSLMGFFFYDKTEEPWYDAPYEEVRGKILDDKYEARMVFVDACGHVDDPSNPQFIAGYKEGHKAGRRRGVASCVGPLGPGEHDPLKVFARECLLGAYSEKELPEKAMLALARAEAAEMSKNIKETPYQIGARMYRENMGISSLVFNVECDSDIPEAQRGYDDALKAEKLRLELENPKQYPPDEYGELYTLKEFGELVMSGALTPDDGTGYWLSKGIKSKYSVWDLVCPEGTTHVVWYSK